jgi:hypothetical protein
MFSQTRFTKTVTRYKSPFEVKWTDHSENVIERHRQILHVDALGTWFLGLVASNLTAQGK